MTKKFTEAQLQHDADLNNELIELQSKMGEQDWSYSEHADMQDQVITKLTQFNDIAEAISIGINEFGYDADYIKHFFTEEKGG